jgi:hypothetical protein
VTERATVPRPVATIEGQIVFHAIGSSDLRLTYTADDFSDGLPVARSRGGMTCIS